MLKPSPIPKQLAAELIEQLRRVLADAAFVTLRTVQPGDGRVDAILPAEIDGRMYEMGVLTRPNAQPRHARSSSYQLRSWQADRADRVGILLAPYISPESAAILQQAGLGYADANGNCRIAFAHVHIQRENFPNRLARRRSAKSIFTPKAERLLRTLLHDPKQSWKLKNLARESHVSIGQAHNVVSFMLNEEWLRRDQVGLQLAQPEALLAQWAASYRHDRSPRRDYYSLANVHETELAIARACEETGTRYAFTGFSAGERLAPMVRYQKIWAYIASNQDEIARRAGLKPVASGANVTLLTPFDEAVLADAAVLDGVSVVSPLQAYLDLHGVSGRGEEAAQAIYEQVLRRSW